MDKVQIIILAGGKGTRMQSEGPKALSLLKGKPFLKRILETIGALHLPIKPIIVVGHKKESILEALGNKQVYANQEEQLGTGHALMSAKKMTDEKHEIILVISGDQPMISKETILEVIKKHKEKLPAITLSTAVLPDFKDWRKGVAQLGRIVRGENKKLKKIVEFRDASVEEKEIPEVNAAIYAFDGKWLWDNITKLNKENSKGEYYITDLIKLAVEQGNKIETVPLKNTLEVLQPNSKEELDILESLVLE